MTSFWEFTRKFLFLIMAILFANETFRCFKKYVNPDMLEVKTKVEYEAIPAPAITFCRRGLKNSSLSSVELYKGCQGDLNCLLKHLYLNESDFIKDIFVEGGKLEMDPTNVFREFRVRKDVYFLPTMMFASCLTVFAEIDLKIGMNFGLSFNMAKEEFIVYIHDHHVAPVNFQSEDLIPLSQENVDLRKASSARYFILMQKIEMVSQINSNQFDCNNSLDYSFIDCWRSRALEKLSGCAIPGTKWDSLKSMEPCQDFKDMKAFYDFFSTSSSPSGRKLIDMLGCLPNCQRSHFMTEHYHAANGFPQDELDGDVILSFAYSGNEVIHKELVPSYDRTSLVADLGGSLGFFLGASAITFFDLFKKGVTRLMRKISLKS